MPPVNPADGSLAAPSPPEQKHIHILPIAAVLVLIVAFLGGMIFLARQNKVSPLLGSRSDTAPCAEDAPSSISTGFDPINSVATIPVFETIFEVPRTGIGKGFIVGSAEKSDVWVAGGKLAYVVTYVKEPNTGEDVLYYDGKEKERAKNTAITPIQSITDRLAYYTESKFVFGSTDYQFGRLDSILEAETLDGKLYLRHSGLTSYNGEQLPRDAQLFSIDGHRADLKFTSLMHTITSGGRTAKVPDWKYTFVYKGKEYGTEYDGFTGTGAVLCNSRPLYIVRELFPADENNRQYVIYDGKIVGGPYFEIGGIKIIGGNIVFSAFKKKEDFKAVLVVNGTETSTKYDSINNFSSHRGHLVYVGVDTETVDSNDPHVINIPAGVSTTRYTYYLVQDGKEVYKTSQNEEFAQTAGSPTIVSIGSKLALLTRGERKSKDKVIYDGVEVLDRYAGAILKIFDLNGKLAALVNDGKKSIIVVESSRMEQVSRQTSNLTEKSPNQDLFDKLSKGTPLEGRILSTADDDYLDGGADEDTSIYSGQRSAYEMYRGNDVPTLNADKTVFIVDKRTGSIDTLVNFELIDFADEHISLPDFKVLSTKVVPIGSATASVRARDRIAVQNKVGRTVSVFPVSMTPTMVTMAVIFESFTQKLLSVPKGGNDIIVLGEDADAPRLSVSVGAIQGDVATLTLTMVQ